MRYRTKVAIRGFFKGLVLIWLAMDAIWNLIAALSHHAGRWGFEKDLGEATFHATIALISLLLIYTFTHKGSE